MEIERKKLLADHLIRCYDILKRERVTGHERAFCRHLIGVVITELSEQGDLFLVEFDNADEELLRHPERYRRADVEAAARRIASKDD